MLNTSPTSLLGAALLVILTMGFGVSMDRIGHYTVPHEFSIQYQSDEQFASTREIADLLYEVQSLLNGNPEYRIELQAHQNPDFQPGVGRTWAELIQDRLIDIGIPKDHITVIDQGTSMLPERDPHETMSLWKKRVNRIDVNLVIPEESN